MQLIVFSKPDEGDRELEIVHNMFEAGLEYFHLRKPKYSTGQLKYYLDHVDEHFRNRIIIHSHHELSIKYKLRGIHLTNRHRKKNYWHTWLLLRYIRFRNPKIEITAGYHTISALHKENPGYSYIFLSPIFDSISKIGYRSTFNDKKLLEALQSTPHHVIAMGGVDEDKISVSREMGFKGVALLGALWNNEDPLEKFKRVKALCNDQ